MWPPTIALLVLTLMTINTVYSDSHLSTNSYLSTTDTARLKKLLAPGLNTEDLSSFYHAIIGYNLLGETVSNEEEACKRSKTFVDGAVAISPETAFYVTSIWKTLGACKDSSATRIIEQIITDVLEKDTSSILDLYHAVSSSVALSQRLSEVTVGKVTRALQTALRKDDSLWNLGYAFHIAAELGASGAFVFDRIEDAVIQADEINGQYLQFEGGLSVTGHIINGIFKLCTVLKKKPPITPQQTVKFANYLLSRRSVQSAKGTVIMLSALNTLAINPFSKPICITLPDGGITISNQQPLVTVKVCDVLGKSLSPVPKVIATSVTRVGDDLAILSDENLESTTDKTLFTMNLLKVNPERGFYKVAVSAGAVMNVVTVKVLSGVSIDYLEIGAGDADQTTQPKLTRVTFPEKLGHKVEADSQQKLVIRFSLKDTSNKKPMRVHQAFVRLSSVSIHNGHKEGHEIIFVAEPDTSLVYKFDMHMGSAAASFGHQSGDYNVDLIIGDAVLSNPFQWTIAIASLKFPDTIAVETTDKNISYGHKTNVYTVKPDIKHMFREPEKRPPAFVSNLFTGLCVAPVLLLIILWIKLGVNISNFPLSVSAVTFHLGLGSIFVLFGVFWLKLNMFVTLRYLLGLGLVTFLAGNKLLSHVAQRHKPLR